MQEREADAARGSVDRRLVTIVLAVLTIGVAGAAIAAAARGDPDARVTGAEADRAGAAALRSTGGGTVVAVQRREKENAAYKVRVRKASGVRTDVWLDASLGVVKLKDKAIEKPKQYVTGTEGERAGAAARRATGGGTVVAVERESKGYAAYKVRVREASGIHTDVWLDASLRVLKVKDKGFEQPKRYVSGSEAERAGAAARRATGGGTVVFVERERKDRVVYEVYVRRIDGSTNKVYLDGSLRVVRMR